MPPRIRKFYTFIKYTLVSLGCTGVDFLLFTLLSNALPYYASYLAARVVSGTLNYQIVRRRLFMKEGSVLRGAWYFALAAGSAAVGSALTQVIAQAGVNPVFAKAGVDTTLFFVNYLVQRYWIFR